MMPLNDNRLLYVVTGQHAGFSVVEVFSNPEKAEAFRSKLTASLLYTRVLDGAVHAGNFR